MAKRDTTIFYQNQINICKKHLNAEQFGRLMFALFEFGEGNDPNVDDDIALAFDFMSLQQRLDREKYERICEQNRINGRKGGAPKGNQNARKQPKQPNAKKNNPNDNDDDNDDENKNENENDNEQIHDSVISLGTFGNVELTEEEYSLIRDTYERSNELIDKVSVWLREAKHHVPDHYALCVKFAVNDQWPQRKIVEPAELYEPVDPLSEEEQAAQVAKMKSSLGGMFKA